MHQISQTVINDLWQVYRHNVPAIQIIERGLQARGIHTFPLDHFAVIDLPGRHTGIPQLTEIFTQLGFTKRGQGYLVDKQNPFIWMAPAEAENQLVADVLPQVVLADFHLDVMPIEIKKIIEKYAGQASTHPVASGATPPEEGIFYSNYFSGRDWPLPTFAEFKTVQAFNELLAWVLIFGRQPNHFTLSVHLLEQFTSLEEFNQFLVNDLKLMLNPQGGVIKGGPEVGIAQSAVTAQKVNVKLSGGEIELPYSFIEFVWRYPKANISNPKQWGDYFTDFVAANADDVVESLYKG